MQVRSPSLHLMIFFLYFCLNVDLVSEYESLTWKHDGEVFLTRTVTTVLLLAYLVHLSFPAPVYNMCWFPAATLQSLLL